MANQQLPRPGIAVKAKISAKSFLVKAHCSATSPTYSSWDLLVLVLSVLFALVPGLVVTVIHLLVSLRHNFHRSFPAFPAPS